MATRPPSTLQNGTTKSPAAAVAGGFVSPNAGAATPGLTNLPGITPAQAGALTGPQQNAYEAVYSTLAAYGLESLAKVLYTYEVQGYDSNTVNYLIQQTPEWQQRFKGNLLLEKQGLAPLDPATYLSQENAYQQALTAAGIPKGMYGKDDFATWIGNNVSVSEIQQRTQLAAQWVNNSDPYFLQALQQYHGIDKGHMTAFALDQSRALPYLNLISQQAQVGASALRAGLNSNPDFAMQLASMVQNGNLSQHDIDTGYTQIAETLPRLQGLAKMSGQQFNQQTAEQATFLGAAAAQRQQLSLVQQEQARFQGSPGLGSNFYHPAYGLSRDMEGAF